MRSLVVLVALLIGVPAAVAVRAPGPAALVFTRYDHADLHGSESVWVAAADGSRAREVAADAYDGQLSADGKWVIYRKLATGNAALGPLVLRNLVTGARRRIGGGTVQWAPSGSRFALARGQKLDLVDAASGKLSRLLNVRFSSYDFAPDGKSIVVALWNGRWRATRSDIFRLRIADRHLVQLTFDGHSEGPVASRAGIAFVRFLKAEPAQEVWVMRGDGGHQRLVVRCCLHRYAQVRAGQPLGYQVVDVSARGDHLVLCQVTSEGCNSFAVDLHKSRPRLLLDYSHGEAVDLSADGRSVLLLEGPFHDAPGHFRLYSVPFAGDRRTLVKWDAIEGGWRR
jgi:Tol biopolymer transport system component